MYCTPLNALNECVCLRIIGQTAKRVPARLAEGDGDRPSPHIHLGPSLHPITLPTNGSKIEVHVFTYPFSVRPMHGPCTTDCPLPAVRYTFLGVGVVVSKTETSAHSSFQGASLYVRWHFSLRCSWAFYRPSNVYSVIFFTEYVTVRFQNRPRQSILLTKYPEDFSVSRLLLD